jgi:hypothetical protein
VVHQANGMTNGMTKGMTESMTIANELFYNYDKFTLRCTNQYRFYLAIFPKHELVQH